MQLVETLPELIKNTLYLEQKLYSKNKEEQQQAINLLKDGICFVKYAQEGKIYFAPSRFIGYKNNSIQKHKDNPDKHGSITNNRIKKIFSQIAKPNINLENEYFNFCSSFGIVPSKKASFGQVRKFWDLTTFQTNIYGDIELPEGKKRMVTHIIKERNPRIRQMVIELFLQKHKSLHCEACNFDFGNKYGTHGKDFIECHHTLPISQMKVGHKTKPEDLVLLCSNCHRMVHKGCNWLTLEELKGIIK